MMNLSSTMKAYGCRYCVSPLKHLLHTTNHHLRFRPRSPPLFSSSFNNLKLPNFNLLLTYNSLFFTTEHLWGRSGMNTNKKMVEHLQQYGVISSEKVARVMETIDRALFVPDRTPAYADCPQEIGTGYLTACFAMMVGPQGRAIGVEHIPELVASSINNIEKSAAAPLLKKGSLSMHVGDGREGWPECAPYDAIHVGAAAPEMPQALLDQLKPGGRMVIPVGNIFQDLKVVDKNPDGSISIRSESSVRYVPLTSRDAQLQS
ncbi:protein-L-isoaspartate O-methyltransferase 1 isoform X2 [Gossypium raimondii]|uniref:protein-L-isoaspartate O-methyltransferase 1 isoform X2 n=1 Tax=Gossypium raimondii TaxID=29730 RepID=UPI00227A8BE5|nr:protein-L-isoaspartate O-methyltransferase 1 isoform X2 [Gossypium raimondii]